MARMHGSGKGISRSAVPYRRTAPVWCRTSAAEIETEICKLARKGMTPSQIGSTLRDLHGVALVKAVTGNKILRILKANGIAPEIPEDLHCLVRKANSIYRHMSRAGSDYDAKHTLTLVTSRIRRLERYYKRISRLDPKWKFEFH